MSALHRTEDGQTVVKTAAESPEKSAQQQQKEVTMMGTNQYT
jgi:hypothetical protein